MVVAACAVGVVGGWIFSVFDSGTTDAAKYKRWGRTGRIEAMVRSMNRRLPASFVSVCRLSHLEEKYGERWEAECEALVASGYLTNVALAITRAEEPPDAATYNQHLTTVIRQTADQIRKALRGRGEFCCTYPSNGVVLITCRPQDVPLCAEALRK